MPRLRQVARARQAQEAIAVPRERITKKTCLSCGGCCVAPSPMSKIFCDVSEEDEKRLGKKFVRLHVLHVSPFDMLVAMVDGRTVPNGGIKTKLARQSSGPLRGSELRTCAMLDGSVMNRVRCRIYDKRPSVCHTAVVPGDQACRAIRKAFREVERGTH